MKASQLMSEDVVTVHMDDTLAEVKAIFESEEFHHLLVVAENKLVGIISDRDLFRALSPKIDTAAATTKDLACLEKKAHQIMTRHPIVLYADATIKQAIDTFNTNKISCIPIVNQSEKPVGVISWRDIMRILAQKMNA